MSVAGHQPPPFFKRGPAPLARLIFFLIVSLVLMAVDQRLNYLETVRQFVSVATYPLQRSALVPLEMMRGGAGYFSSLAAVQAQNEALRRRQVESAAGLLRASQLEAENRRFRALLEMKERQPARGIVAEILYTARDPFSRKIVIDKGVQQGVQAGYVVVDDVGIIGQVTRSYSQLAEITLISDKDQAIPVQVLRTGQRAVLFGAGTGAMELRYLAANVDVKVGDDLVTSGLDGIFLPGLPVARVTKVERDDGYAFARIVCQSAGAVESHGLVLVLSPRLQLPPRPVEVELGKSDTAARHAQRSAR